MRRAFGIRTQAVAVSVIPLLFLVAVLVLSVIFQRAADDVALRAGRTTQILSESDRIYALLDVQSRAAERFRRTHRPADLAPYAKAATDLTPTLDRLARLVAAENVQTALYQRYRQQTFAVAALVRRLRDAVVAHDEHARAKLLAAPQTNAQILTWRNTKTSFDQTERTLALERYSAARREIEPYRRATLACAAVGVVVTLLFSVMFGLRIARRLRRLEQNAVRLAAGRPASAIGGADEIASLDAVYRYLTTQLRHTVEEKEAALSAYDREHHVASTLQRALLPQRLPEIAGLRIDSAYVSAGEAGVVGGDWYDVFSLSEHVVGISAGDVAGHGLRAATRMNAVRQSIRTAARAADDPSVVLRHVNRVLCADETDAFVTAFYATFDLRAETMRYAIAGHPPPIVIQPDGSAALLHGDGVVLGIDPRVGFETQSVRIAAGAALVVYTDGLIEHQHAPIAGTRELIEAARAEFARPSPNLAEGLQHRVLNGAAPSDDSAVLFICSRGAGTRDGEAVRRVWSFDARDEVEATRVKRALLWELAGFEAGTWDLGTIEIIYGELASNVARHTPGPATVVLERRGDELVLRVQDRGAPFTPSDAMPDLLAESGRGLFLIRALASDLRVEALDDGNRVTVVLPRPPDAPRLRLENGQTGR